MKCLNQTVSWVYLVVRRGRDNIGIYQQKHGICLSAIYISLKLGGILICYSELVLDCKLVSVQFV